MATKPAWPSLSQANCQGTTNAKVKSNVKALQCLLNYRNSNTALLDDGDFGSVTTTAVKSYQSKSGLFADGIAGPITLSHLIVDVRSVANGQAAKAAQHLISKFATILVDGNFGATSDGIAKTFQGKMGLAQDGLIGPISWQYASGYSIYPTTAQSSAGVHFTSPVWPTLSEEICKGPISKNMSLNIKALQCLLNFRNGNNALLDDGSFGSITTNALKSYQSKNGLAVDGVAGPVVLPKLIATVNLNNQNLAAKAAQYLISKYTPLVIDGQFGAKSLESVKLSQKTMGLLPDGVVGVITWSHLFGDDVPQNSGSGAVHAYAVTKTGDTLDWYARKDNVQYIFNYLRSNGFTKQAAFGVIGNMDWESHLNPGVWEVTSNAFPNKGYGLLQWTPCTKFLNWAKINSSNASAVNTLANNNGHQLIDKELEFFIADCKNLTGYSQWIPPTGANKHTPYSVSFNTFMKLQVEPGVLATAFCDHYERPAKGYENFVERETRARNWYGTIAG